MSVAIFTNWALGSQTVQSYTRGHNRVCYLRNKCDLRGNVRRTSCSDGNHANTGLDLTGKCEMCCSRHTFDMSVIRFYAESQGNGMDT